MVKWDSYQEIHNLSLAFSTNDNILNMPASALVVPNGKAFSGIPLPVIGRETVGNLMRARNNAFVASEK